MKRLFAGLLMLTLAGCAARYSSVGVEESWGPNPWYTYCTWDSPCWYSNNSVFVYGWGRFDRPTYYELRSHPFRRERWEHRRQNWHPRNRPAYRGQDWDSFRGRVENR